MSKAAATASVLSVRVSAPERALLKAAADQTRTSLSDFIRRNALEAAELEILSRSAVVIPGERWAAFEAWLERPAEKRPELERLAAFTPTWAR